MDSGGRERNATSTPSRARAVEARVSVEYTAYNNQSLSMSIISAIVREYHLPVDADSTGRLLERW